MDYAKEEARAIILTALANLVSKEKIKAVLLPAFNIEIPSDNSHGDLSCNAALVSSKALGINPRAFSLLIIEEAELNGTIFERLETAGPGFINFFVNKEWYAHTVSTVLSAKENYGKTDFGNGKRVLIEFVSANPTGPMHIGNARGGALGDCLASVMEFAGYYVEREFYVNDAGNQINKFGLSLDIRYQQTLGIDIEMPEDSYHGDDIVDHVSEYIENDGVNLLHVSEEERRKALVDYALPINIKTLENDLLKYRIKYDTWFRESVLHENNATFEVVELLKQKGHTYEADGAVWLNATKFGAEKDIVLIRSNGVPTYIVPDIAYHYNKLVTRNYDLAINVLGADHHDYKTRMNVALEALGLSTNKLKVVIMQMVRLVRSGETIKLSKRSGKAITLSTLLDEVPIDAARFIFNLRDANTHLEFDLDLAIEESSKNPVFYVQYAHARICSIIERLARDNIKFDENTVVNYTEPAEFDLIRKTALLPSEINEAARELNPSRMTRYVLELAQIFHKFYDTCKIRGEEENILQSRLALCIAVKIVIKNVLDLLKVEAPEKM